MSEPGFVAETLAWCNERRAEKGLRPLVRLPKGVRHNGASCPCGEATGLFVGHMFYGEHENYLRDELPMAVQVFVATFDEGELPQYDEAAA